jgi:hypothetical protein
VLKLAAPVPELLPDLIETAVSNPPADSMAGSSFSVTDTVNNRGSASAGTSITSYYFSLDAIKGRGDILLTGSRSVPSLGINGTNDGIGVTVTIPSSTAVGSYFLLACADDTNLVEENNENNNCIASASKVSVGPVVSVTATDPAATEGGDTGTFRITRTGATTSGLSVRFAMSGSARNGSDYNTIASIVTIPAGAAFVDIVLTPINDLIYEGDESAVLTLSANAAYQIGSSSSDTITIHDNDPAPSFSVISPNGGESLPSGMTQTIRWNYTGNPGAYLKIELLKGGVLNKVITSLARTSARSFNWRLPVTLTPGTDYSIRITSRRNPVFTDTSDSNFTIAAPTVTLVSPNGGENWVPGTTQTIRWTFTGGPGTYLKIELLKGGILNRTITNLALTSRRSFNWRIPALQVPGADYSIRITSRTNPSWTDTGDLDFTIGP